MGWGQTEGVDQEIAVSVLVWGPSLRSCTSQNLDLHSEQNQAPKRVSACSPSEGGNDRGGGRHDDSQEASVKAAEKGCVCGGRRLGYPIRLDSSLLQPLFVTPAQASGEGEEVVGAAAAVSPAHTIRVAVGGRHAAIYRSSWPTSIPSPPSPPSPRHAAMYRSSLRITPSNSWPTSIPSPPFPPSPAAPTAVSPCGTPRQRGGAGGGGVVSRAGGALMLLGDNTFGQLGMGDYEACDAPRVVQLALREEDVACVACGRAHTLAVTKRGEVYAWGCGGHGRLGLDVADAVPSSDAPRTTTPTHALPALVKGLRGVCIVQVACGSAAPPPKRDLLGPAQPAQQATSACDVFYTSIFAPQVACCGSAGLHTSVYVSIACSIRQFTSVYVSIHQHILQHSSHLSCILHAFCGSAGKRGLLPPAQSC